MQRWIFRPLGVTAFLLLVTTLSHAGVCFGGFLSEDSARFATYWSLVESGEAKAAHDTLMDVGGEGRGCAEQMANFLLAWRASSGGDYGSVPVFLDLGVPANLADYALWLRADALNHAGQDALAMEQWKKLADDTTSALCPDALYQLADHEFEKGMLDDCLGHTVQYSRFRADTDDRQHIEFVRGQTLAMLGRHDEAVDALWRAYVLAPLSGEGSRVRTLLDGYAKRFGHNPRMETSDEREREFGAMDQRKQYALGLERIERELKSIQPRQIEEVLRFYKGRFENALSHHRDAIETLQAFLTSFPQSEFRYKANYYLGRSAYLIDRDAEAIPALTEAGSQTGDLDIAGKALDLLGTLQLDRNRPQEAVNTYQHWQTVSKGTGVEADCLWKLGRALWDGGHFAEAEKAYQSLYDYNENADYAPAALYWLARSATKAGHKAEARQNWALLQSRFPYSYNAIIAPVKPDSVVIEQHPLACPSLDDVWEAGGEHCKKFALLAAMRIPEFSLRELPWAIKEMPEANGLPWWKAQFLLWQGQRMAAWRVVLTELGTYLRTAGSRPAAFNAVSYPLDFDPQIVRLASQYHLDPYFVFGLICQESHFEEGIVSPAGATGLMQLMPKTAYMECRSLGIGYAARKLRDPDYNLQIGVAHLSRLFADFRGDSVLILAAYNAGPSAAQSWASEFHSQDRDDFIEHIPYRETRMYVKRNIEHAAAYRRLYPDIVTTLQLNTPAESPAPQRKPRAAYGVHKRRTH
ncbi:MAG TPA: transglycosylase SLT domain-containing protein [bacterium]|jgi:soluble lytic murein transglycosylase